jgi:hypothetical protein
MVPVGVSIVGFLDFWESLALNPFIRDIVTKGHTILFNGDPPPFAGVKSTPLKGKFVEVLMQEVQILVTKGAVMEIPENMWNHSF